MARAPSRNETELTILVTVLLSYMDVAPLIHPDWTQLSVFWASDAHRIPVSTYLIRRLLYAISSEVSRLLVFFIRSFLHRLNEALVIALPFLTGLRGILL